MNSSVLHLLYDERKRRGKTDLQSAQGEGAEGPRKESMSDTIRRFEDANNEERSEIE